MLRKAGTLSSTLTLQISDSMINHETVKHFVKFARKSDNITICAPFENKIAPKFRRIINLLNAINSLLSDYYETLYRAR